MEEKQSYETREMNEDEAVLVLFLLLTQNATKHASETWEEFVEDIKYNRRFFPSSRLLDIIQSLKECAAIEIPKEAIYYRARVFRTSFLDEPAHSIEREKILNLVRNSGIYKNVQSITDLNRLALLDPLLQIMHTNEGNLIDTLKQVLKTDKQWWGYDSKGSDAPPREIASAGRANAKHISYLYLADNEKTALYEVRPSIGQEVSIATIVIKRQLKIFDLCAWPTNEMADIDKWENAFLLQMLSRLFSEVNYGLEDEYIPTQYICDYIRNLGFDGIRFGSALNPDGKVVVLFDTNADKTNSEDNNYEIINSRVFKINKYDIDYTQIAPWKE